MAARLATPLFEPLHCQASRYHHVAIARWHAIVDDCIVAIVAVITARAMLPAQIPIAQRRF